MESNHPWKFFIAGGLKQVRFEKADDYRKIGELDQKLWVALSMPTRGLEFDTRTLDLIDVDKDGRIRAPELVQAVTEACSLLKDPACLAKGSPSLPLSSIDDSHPAGKAVLAAARQILSNLGKSGASEISVSDVSDTAAIFAKTSFNGDGVIVPASVSDEAARALLNEILATYGGRKDRSGADGIDLDCINAFFADLAALDAWWKAGEALSDSLPLGLNTADADATLKTIRAKVDDFFARCQLAAYDSRAVSHLNRPDSEYAAAAASDLSSFGPEILNLPLAQVAAGRNLPLKTGINPAWVAAVEAFRVAVVAPLLGPEIEELTPKDWAAIKARFGAFEGWLGSKPVSKVEGLGPERVRAILASDLRAKLEAAVTADLELKPQADGIDAVERLVRYHRDLQMLLDNYVSFTHLYNPKAKTIFQAGTLILDSRACDLCLEIADVGAHAGLAGLSRFYIAYCEVTRPGGQKKLIAALFTQGDSDYLMVGRNGIFYDRKGVDWDARIIRVLDNPISIRQAFWSPYKKFVRMIEEQIAKRAAAAEAKSDSKLSEAAASTANAGSGAAAAKPAAPKKFDLAIVTGIGVALGSIGTFLASIFTELVSLAWWQFPVIILVLMLAISTPSMVLAWLKLRQRTLGPVLDANGWAINGRVKVNIPLGATMTHVAHLPPGSTLDLRDPFDEKKSPWPRILIVVALLGSIYTFVARNQISKGNEAWWLPKFMHPPAAVSDQPAPAAETTR
jgi:hypothetical protein